ncbi:MAG: sigma-70 family RNA polymerase sigma factor, partial [Actinobacteria bacterium]
MSATHTAGLLGRVRVSAKSDEALLDRARNGDEAAFEELHRRNRDAVLGYCLLRLQDRGAAEEATQDVFLKAHLSSGEPVKNVKAWLFTVAHNAVIDASRRMRSVPVSTDLEAVVDSIPSVGDEDAFESLDVTSNVFIALRRLPARDRKAIIMREFQDKSSQQISQEMNVSIRAVDVLLCRARAAFGRAYAEVSDMPYACRQATELIYRDMGSGITDEQRRTMELH